MKANTMIRGAVVRGASSLALFTALPCAAHAQTDSDVEEIVVTALKRSQTVQDIPASISAVSGEALQTRGIQSVADLKTAVPNLDFGQHTGTTLVSIRGVGSVVDSGVTEPTVASYVDGIFLPRATMGYLRGVDLERIEVLRGPQGTLYGRNATGGAINFISKEPSRELTAGINLSTGSFHAFGASGYISGPLSDSIRFRISGGHEQDDGYVRWLPGNPNIADTNVDYVRGALQIDATERLKVDLAVRYEKSNGANGYQQLFTNTILPTPGQTTAPNQIYGDHPYLASSETLIASGKINWELTDNITLRSVSGYVDHKNSVDFDADATDIPFFYATNFKRPSQSFGQELTLIGTGTKLDWIAGAYYFHEKAGNSLPLGIGAALAGGFGVPADTLLTQSVDTKTNSIALFGDATYAITDAFKLNLGLRYNHETKNFLQDVYLVLPGGTIAPIVTAAASRLEANRLLPKVNVQYQFADRISGYAQWSRGFKSGGENLPGGGGELAGAAGLYKPEVLNAYEIGLKTQTADRRLTANFSAFYYDYTGLQVTITRPPAVTLVQNAPAEIYGVEAEMQFHPDKRLTIEASANYLHARFKQFSSIDDARPSLGPVNVAGQALPHAPDFSGQLGVQYRIPFDGAFLSSLTFRADASYRSKIVLRYFGQPQDIQEGYGLVNLSATLGSHDDKARVRVFVNNVTDKLYRQNSTYLVTGAYYGNYGAPRTWGVQLSADF
ncbi:MAG TPA: TonB-dependent receptor [Sphingobium sp.]